MKQLQIFLAFMLITVCYAFVQTSKPSGIKTQAMPMPYYLKMLDSTTSIDVVFMLGQGGSISVEGRNTHVFNSFFESVTAPKLSVPQAGTVMWEIHGREFLSGNIYLSDTSGYVVVNLNGKEYVNRINAQGTNFFRGQGRKQ